MTAPLIALAEQVEKPQTLTDKLAQFFRERPLTWIDGMELARIAGHYAWRSRCSDLRKRGMTIENRQRRGIDTRCRTQFVTSEYRFIPAEAK